MLLRKRIIVCLDVQEGRVVGGGRPAGVRDPGNPVELAVHYQDAGADELAILDRSAAPAGRQRLLDTVRLTAERLFVPLTVGGGIADLAGMGTVLRAGADKVTINSALVANPELLAEAAQRYGKECIVAGIDARAERRQTELLARPEGAPFEVTGAASPTDWFRVFTHAGRTATLLDAVAWARQCAEHGAGEVLLTTIDQAGQRGRFDLELTARVVEAVSVPVIACGGGVAAEHIRDVFLLAGADAALGADVFHDGTTTVAELKRLLLAAGIPVRMSELRAELNEQQLP